MLTYLSMLRPLYELRIGRLFANFCPLEHGQAGPEEQEGRHRGSQHVPPVQKLKKILKNLVLITLPTLFVFFLLLEVISRFFFPGREIPHGIYDTTNHMRKFDRKNGTRGLWTAGPFAQQGGRWRINNDGWNSPIDYSEQKKAGVKRIAVIGDSYIEAWQVDAEKSYPSLLGDSLGPNYEVYSFGVSASPLSQYLFVSRYVEKKYSPDIYIFNLVHNDFHESINGIVYNPWYMTIKLAPGGTFTEVQPIEPERDIYKVPGGEILRISSLVRYVYFDLNLMQLLKTKKTLANEKVEMNVNLDDILDRKDSLRAVTNYVLGKIKTELGSKQIIIVMDAPRTNIYNGDLANSRVAWLNTMVGEVCKELNLDFVDLTPYMLADYQKSGKHFESMHDYHWANYGHEFVAHVLYDHFKNLKQ